MSADLEAAISIKVLDAFSGPLRQLGLSLTQAGGAASKLDNAFKFAGDLNQAAEGAGRFASMLATPLKGAVMEFVGFEKQMSKVAALSNEIGTEGFEKMREQALELGAATSYSSEEAAEAMAQYAQAGRSVNEILAVTPLTLAAAKANGLGLAETAAIIGHTMSGMGIATSETARVVDVLTVGAASSDMTLGDMGQALAYVGPVARQAGMSLELTAAFMGKMKDAGLEASSVGTGLRATLARLLDPSKEATKAFGALGIHSKQLAEIQKLVASGKADEALKRIGTAAEKLPNEKRMKLLSQIFGLEASTAANVAITASMDVSPTGLRALEAKLKAVDNDAKKLAKVMEDNLGGEMERASGAISGLATSVGALLKPTVSAGAKEIEKFAGGMQKWVKDQPRAAKATFEFMAAIAGLSFVLKGGLLAASTFVSATETVVKSFGVLRGSLIGQAGLVGASFAAGYAIGNWANETFDLANKISGLLGQKAPEGSSTKQQTGPVLTETYGDGTVLDAKTGAVLKMGKGPARLRPKEVRDAFAAGAKTDEEVSAHIGQARLAARVAAAPKPRELRAYETGEEKPAEFKPGPWATPQANDAAVKEQTVILTRATKEQTAELAQALDANAAATREMVEETRRQRGRTGAGGRAAGGTGAF